MATKDPLPLEPDRESSRFEPIRGSPEVLNLSDSFGLDDFASEGEETSSLLEEQSPPPASDPAFEDIPDHTGGESTVRTEPPLADRVLERVLEPSTANGGAVTLRDLLERQDGLDWREAVAVVHELCVQLKDSSPERPALLEPGNIQITPSGEIRVMPGHTGGDPLVIQIGRLLRALLLDKSAPPDVRLLLSRATFELPIFESVEDVARALRQVSGNQLSEDLRSAYARAASPPPASLIVQSHEKLAPVPRPILPVPYRSNRKSLTRLWRRSDRAGHDALLVAAAVVGVAVLTGLVLNYSTSRQGPAASSAPLAAVPLGVAVVTPPASAVPEGAPAAPLRADPPVDLRSAIRPSDTTPVAKRANRPSAASAGAGTVVSSSGPPSAVQSSAREPDAALNAARESERRAAALITKGLSEEAVIAFDALVMNNPLYEPNRFELTPEAYSTFLSSRRVLLPGIAKREFDRAKALLDAGDFDRALVTVNQVDAILDRIESEQPALRKQVRELRDKATQARLAADEIVYSPANPAVVPPRPLSRQFPATSPDGVPANRVGILEMVIGRQGEVEFVKLHTPLNRYHERMIVSAAKAWRYQPATKDGRAVRYRLTVTINLPESGTN